MTRPAPIIAGTLAALLLSLGTYIAAYCAMLLGKLPVHVVVNNIEAGVMIQPIYRDGSGLAEFAFGPAHKLDRLIRPSFWGDE